MTLSGSTGPTEELMWCWPGRSMHTQPSSPPLQAQGFMMVVLALIHLNGGRMEVGEPAGRRRRQ